MRMVGAERGSASRRVVDVSGENSLGARTTGESIEKVTCFFLLLVGRVMSPSLIV